MIKLELGGADILNNLIYFTEKMKAFCNMFVVHTGLSEVDHQRTDEVLDSQI
jgi:hypothetical protein